MTGGGEVKELQFSCSKTSTTFICVYVEYSFSNVYHLRERFRSTFCFFEPERVSVSFSFTRSTLMSHTNEKKSRGHGDLQ